jgi:hypothetical protein
MNFDIPKIPEKKSETEKIVSGAIRYRGEVFTGQFHADAVTKIWELYPETKEDMTDFEEGFVTSTGRFVDRKEAGEIAEIATQLTHLDLAERAYAIANLDCEDIEGEQPDPLKKL